jgi:class 3 adenylate cyclase/tetratricopeptide (TPR) repeat protein
MGRTTAVVLFTDLVGSTELRGRLGEEAAEDLRRRHDRLLAQAVEGNDGRVVKGLGDGIMATFAGASDAVAAAVAIQQAVERLNRSGKMPVPLAVRVGLSAGDVAFEDDDVHGTPVIEASRLCAVAVGGEILASEIVRWLGGAQGAASFIPVGSLELKGLASPVPAVRIIWEPAPASSIPMPALLTGAGRIFVGRDAELDRLQRLWKEAVAGERRLALLAGEPGVGKTRLASEVAARAHGHRGLVLAGRCDEDLGVPYQPFVAALRHFVDHSPSEGLGARLGRYGGELARLVPELADVVPDLPPPLRSDPETERYRLFDGVASWLAAAAAEEPLLLVLDDLQWAAKPTLLLLRHVLRSADPMSLLVVATYRDSDIGRTHPLTEFLADLRREPGVERVALTGLDPTAVADYLIQAAGHDLDDTGEELARAVWRETEGSPFFVTEVVRHLAESGAIEQRDGRWVVTATLDELGIPEGVRDVVGRRLSRLSQEANKVLACASVVGLEFEPSVVQAAGHFDEDTVLAALEEATDARLLVDVPGPVPCNRFAHGLVRATLYDELSAARRVAWHRKVAEAIEALHAEGLADHLAALAHHWARASAPTADTARAVDYAARAGDQALAQLAHDEAVTYYRQALDLLDAAGASDTDSRRIELLISLGQAQLRSGDPAYRETLLTAAALGDAAGDPGALARAALANSRGFFSLVLGIDSERVAVLERAVAALDPGDAPERARLLANLADELGFSTDHARRRQLTDDALAMARRLNDPATLAHVLARRCLTLPITPERHPETMELAEVAAGLNDPTLVCTARAFRSLTQLAIGDAPSFIQDIDDAVRLADQLGQPSLRWLSRYIQSNAYRLAGRLEQAEVRGRQAFEIAEAAGMPDARLIFFGVNLFWVRYDQGRLDELLDRFERTAARSAPNPEPTFLGLIYGELDRTDDARRILEALAVDDFGRVPGNNYHVFALAVRAELCAAVGHRAHAATLHRLLLPFRGQVPTSAGAAPGAVDHQLAMLSTVLGRFDDAEIEFRSAVALHEHLAAPAWLARTHLEWARMLLTRGQPGDAGRGRELLGLALDSARDLGLGTVERRAVALLGDCP